MALNLHDRRVILESDTMQVRCTSVVINYALYILGNGASTTNQKGWAREALRDPAKVGRDVSVYLLNNPTFTDTGSSIVDDGEQGIKGPIETAINNNFVQPEPEVGTGS